jgi:hypothetical protein
MAQRFDGTVVRDTPLGKACSQMSAVSFHGAKISQAVGVKYVFSGRR